MEDVLPAEYGYLITHQREIAQKIVATLVNEVSMYRMLPAEVIDNEVVKIIESNLRLFVEVISHGKDPSPAELREVAASAARRAQERLPLDAMVAAYHIAFEVAWQTLVDVTPADNQRGLLDAARHVLRHLRTTMPVIALAYMDEHQLIHGEERDARIALVNALLAGEPTDGFVIKTDVQLAPSYLVLRLSASFSATEVDVTATVAGRRTSLAIQAELDAYAHTPVLSALDQHGGTVLYPADPDSVPRLTAELPALVERIGTVIDRPLTVGMAPALNAAEIPEAHRQATELADLAHRLGRPPGTYQLGDLLLEYQIARPGSGLEMMATILAPLEEHGHLIEALRALTGNDYNRRKAATQLCLHPNTLDYRMRRIAVLTGLDPHQPHSGQMLRMALLARDLSHGAE